MFSDASSSDSKITSLVQQHLNEFGLQSLGVIRLTNDEFTTIVFFVLLYGLAMGVFGRLLLGRRGLSWVSSTLISLFAILLSIVVYALVRPYPDGTAVAFLLFVSAILSAFLLASFAVLKHCARMSLDRFLSGARPDVPRRETSGLLTATTLGSVRRKPRRVM